MKLLISIFVIICLLLPTSFAADSKHACGAVSLYHLATLLGIAVSLEKTDTALKEKQGGSRITSFAELIECGKDIGLELQGVKLTYTELQTFQTPVIAHLRATFDAEKPSAADEKVGHFIVVEHTTKKWVRIFDTPKSSLGATAAVISRDRFLELWTGKAVILSEKQQSYWQTDFVVSPTLFDFGRGEIGEYGTPVELRNRSSAPLKILNIAADCNCTVATQQTDLIRAGATTFLDVTWDASAANRSLFTTVHIQTDAQKRPHTFVSLGLIREFSLVFIPEMLAIQGTGTTNLKRRVELQNLNETAAKILKLESSQPWIQSILRSNPVIHPWRAADIEINFETEQIPRDEMIHETLTVHYEESDGKTKTLPLPISGKVNQRYTLIPNRFFFGRIKASEENTKAVVLDNAIDTDIQVEDVETDVGTAEVKKIADENRYEVWLTLPPLLPTGILKGEVRTHTNHPKNRLIKVPVFGIVVQ